MSRNHVAVALLASLLTGGCTASTVTASATAPIEAPTATASSAATPPATAQPTGTQASLSTERQPSDLCGDAIVLFGGSTGEGFNAAGDTSGAVDAAVCETFDGRVSFAMADHHHGEVLSVPVCQESPEIWQANVGDIVYVVVDERKSQRSTPGVLYRWDDADRTSGIVRNFESNIERSVVDQERFGTPLCDG